MDLYQLFENKSNLTKLKNTSLKMTATPGYDVMMSRAVKKQTVYIWLSAGIGRMRLSLFARFPPPFFSFGGPWLLEQTLIKIP